MPPPLQNYKQLLDRFTTSKRRSIDLEKLSINFNVVDRGVTSDDTGQVKVKMFDDLPYLALGHTTAVSNGNKSIKQHGPSLGHF